MRFNELNESVSVRFNELSERIGTVENKLLEYLGDVRERVGRVEGMLEGLFMRGAGPSRLPAEGGSAAGRERPERSGDVQRPATGLPPS